MAYSWRMPTTDKSRALAADLLAVRDQREAITLVDEAEQYLSAHPQAWDVMTAMEQAQRIARQPPDNH